MQISLISSTDVINHDSVLHEGAKLQDYGKGDMWLVDSAAVSIQARYLPDDEAREESLYVRAIAVGGPFLHGNTLIVGPLNAAVMWNGMAILASQESTFEVAGLIRATRHLNSSLVENLSVTNPGVDATFPMGVHLILNRQEKHINVNIQMPPLAGGQEGLCGNYNGNANDDTLQLILQNRQPKVSAMDSLFPDYMD